MWRLIKFSVWLQFTRLDQLFHWSNIENFMPTKKTAGKLQKIVVKETLIFSIKSNKLEPVFNEGVGRTSFKSISTAKIFQEISDAAFVWNVYKHSTNYKTSSIEKSNMFFLFIS